MLADSTGATTTFTKTSDLTTGLKYSFKVRAINAVDPSPFSEIVQIIAGTIPGKPATPTKYSASVDAIEIRWTEPDNGGSVITNYNVYWDNGVGDGNFILKGSSNGYETFTVTKTDDNLVAGRSYEFKVSAVNGVGEGP